MAEVARQVRRAVVDDLPQLRELWREAGFPQGDLERRFTEFQVVADSVNRVEGALAIQISELQGLVRWEAYRAKPAPTELQEMLWTRLLTVTKNNGVWLLWSLSGDEVGLARGFTPTAQERAKKIPAVFEKFGAAWFTLQLKEEAQPPSLDAEFKLFVASQKAETERALKQGKGLRAFAYLLLTVVVGLLIYGGILLVQEMAKRPG